MASSRPQARRVWRGSGACKSSREFFSRATAHRLLRERGPSDLMIGNNVLAHVPDINDFVAGFVIMLKKNGVATFEFPHLLKLINGLQFDTIYHEHFSYPSLNSVVNVFTTGGLQVFDVEEIPTHGGSLRVYAQRADSQPHAIHPRVAQLLDKEIAAGLKSRAFYATFQESADRVTFDLISFLIRCRAEGKSVIAYGAAAKGNTLLNYAGIKPNLLPCVYDASPAKSDNFLPGSHIPIYPASEFTKRRADYVLILPWNLTEEIIPSLSPRSRAGRQMGDGHPPAQDSFRAAGSVTGGLYFFHRENLGPQAEFLALLRNFALIVGICDNDERIRAVISDDFRSMNLF